MTRTIAITLARTFASAWQASPPLFVWIALLYAAEAFMPLVLIYLMKWSTDAAIEAVRGAGNADKALLLLFLQTAAITCSFVVNHLRGWANFKLQYKLSYAFRKRILVKSGRLPLVFFDVPDSYDRLERASRTAERGIALFQTVFDMARGAITLIGYLAMLLSIYWLLPVGMLILMVPSLLVNVWTGKRKYGQMREQTEAARRAHYLAELLKGRDTAKELKIFGHFDYLIASWSKLFLKNASEQYELEKKTGAAGLAVTVIRDVSSFLFIASLLWLAIRGDITYGEFFAFSSGISLSLSLIVQIADGLGKLHGESLFMTDFFGFLELEEEYVPLAVAAKPDGPGNGDLTLDNVSFRYPGSDRDALRNVTFRIRRGEKLAIVGDNGAGKSTLVKCLMGLYTPTGGRIAYGGIDIAEWNRDDWRSHFSAIFQDFVHYQLTARENIGLGRLDRIDDLEAVEAAAAKADVKEAILNLRNGFETELGTAFQGGQDLSGGQWQKIGLSRTLFKNAEVMVLDEPTAALDPLAESRLLESFLELSSRKTAIFITHRLGSCKHVDRIIVLKDGSVVEEGSHEELMRRGEAYARMFEAQSRWYV